MEQPAAAAPALDQSPLPERLQRSGHGWTPRAAHSREQLMGERELQPNTLWPHFPPPLGQQCEQQQKSFLNRMRAPVALVSPFFGSTAVAGWRALALAPAGRGSARPHDQVVAEGRLRGPRRMVRASR
jgi:hypothetical protein